MSLNIALNHASLGLYVFPVARNKAPLTRNGYLDATMDEAIITAWWQKFPNANVGFASGKSGKSVLDIDHGLVDEASLRTWCRRNGIATETYIVRSGSRPDFKVHIYFDGTMPDCNWELDGCSGQVKSLKGYVLAAGSIAEHRSASHAPYEVLAGSFGTFAPLPDVIRNLRQKDGQPEKHTWALPVHDGEFRRGFMVQQAGKMRHIGSSKEVVLSHLLELNANPAIIAEPLPEEELEKIARSIERYAPASPEPDLVLGETPASSDAELAEESPHPVYPDGAWTGTVYGAFADIVCRGNDIPHKIVVESFRIVTGALVGDQVSCGVAGVRLRDYAAMIAPPQSGKGIAEDCTVRFYRDVERPLLWGYDSEYRPAGVGAQRFSPGSSNSFVDQANREEASRIAQLKSDTKGPKKAAIEVQIDRGLSEWKPCARYITIKGEALNLLSKFANDWTGQDLAALLTDLYDGTSAEAAVTKDRGVPKIPVNVQYSMLLYTQPHIWRKHVAESLVDSGLFGRFYIVGSERVVRQEQLPDYAFPELFERHFGPLRREVFARIIYLADHPLLMTVSADASRRLNEWEKEQARLSPLDGIDRSRLGLHVWRAAMARAWGWMPRRTEISLEDAETAILLGEYQVRMREWYAPTMGDDREAVAINKVRDAVRIAGRLTLGELKRRVHADRMGRRFDASLEYLRRKGEVVKQPGKRQNQSLVLWVAEK